jgi:hypothetical protein
MTDRESPALSEQEERYFATLLSIARCYGAEKALSRIRAVLEGTAAGVHPCESDGAPIGTSRKPSDPMRQQQPKPEPREETCLWTSDEDGIWTASCKQDWLFEEGSPRDNKMRFCHFCGRPLRQRSYRER